MDAAVKKNANSTLSQKPLIDLHDILSKVLIEALAEDNPDPKMVAQARQFLKDNGIVLDVVKLQGDRETPHPLEAIEDEGGILPFKVKSG